MWLCSPGLRVQHETGPGVPGQTQESLQVAGQRGATLLMGEQGVGSERRNVDAVIEDQVCLEAGVVQEHVAVELGKVMSVDGHGIGTPRVVGRMQATW